MISDYLDIEHEALTRYLDRIGVKVNGIQRIIAIFTNIKNSIEYNNNTDVFQKASETLVIGSGNNFSKNILLCAVLRLSGFNCNIRYRYVHENERKIVYIKKEILPWFYVVINYMSKDIELDCSLNKEFMSAARVWYVGDEFDFKIDQYYCNEKQAFEILSEEKKIDELKDLNEIFHVHKDSIWKVVKRILL